MDILTNIYFVVIKFAVEGRLLHEEAVIGRDKTGVFEILRK